VALAYSAAAADDFLPPRNVRVGDDMQRRPETAAVAPKPLLLALEHGRLGRGRLDVVQLPTGGTAQDQRAERRVAQEAVDHLRGIVDPLDAS
jgi:hypothetical protein